MNNPESYAEKAETVIANTEGKPLVDQMAYFSLAQIYATLAVASAVQEAGIDISDATDPPLDRRQ